MNLPFPATALDALKAGLASRPRRLLIGGQWREALSGQTIEVIDPAREAVFAKVAAGGAGDIALAVTEARRAFDQSGWPMSPPAQRQRLLLRLADLLETHGEELALIESLDNGMPFMMARHGGVTAAAELLRYFAGWATKISGETLTPSWPGEYQAFTWREPVGVVGAIVPWNLPLVMAVAKLAPALAVGCTVILKPAEQTPLSAIRLGELILEAGFPDGVVNIVTGYGETAGAALVEDPRVDKISFTGSTSVGRAIVRAATGNLKRVSLELGGKSPAFIFPDADLARAIPSAAMGIFGNSGQVCAAGSRLFVHEKIFDEVLEGIAKIARSLNVGPGVMPNTQIGPLVSADQLDRVLGYIHSGRSEGASLLAGGQRVGEQGYFVQPTVFTDTLPTMKMAREEVFGPVLCATRFGDDDIDLLAARANDSDYGLAAYIWTSNINTALRLSRRLKAGSVRINGGGPPDPALPLGGFKQSGWGRENGRAGVEAYTEVKTVSVSL